MAGKSNYLEDKVINWALKGVAMGTAPTSAFVALHTADPTDAGLTTAEVTTTIRGAGRVAAVFGSIATAAGANSVSNTNPVDFGAAAGVPGGQVTWFSLWDAASGGNMLYSAALTTPRTIQAGGNVSFPAGALVVQED